MHYVNQAVVQKELTRTIQEDRLREAARYRFATETLAGRQERTTNPIPGLLDRVRKLAKQEPRITPEPAS